MVRKHFTLSRPSQFQFNTSFFPVLFIVTVTWFLTGCQVIQNGTTPNDVRGTPVPRSTADEAASNNPTATLPVRGTPVPAPFEETPAMPEDVEEAFVVDVIDGDTLDVRLGGRVERVRLIGLNTPESADPRRAVQCFGVESSVYNKSLTLDQTVFLEEDLTQGSRDQFDRLLRYVWLPDGRLVNLELIANGYAAQYTFDTPYKYRDLFRSAERSAKDANNGLWSPQTCDGDFDAPADYGERDSDGTMCADGCIQPPAGCSIKGNVNASGRHIYHVDGLSDAYDNVNMNPGEGDRWFCSVDEAEAAGFVSAP